MSRDTEDGCLIFCLIMIGLLAVAIFWVAVT